MNSTADRKCFIGGKTIEEYYWNGKYVVYVDNVLVEGKFEEICADIESKKNTHTGGGLCG